MVHVGQRDGWWISFPHETLWFLWFQRCFLFLFFFAMKTWGKNDPILDLIVLNLLVLSDEQIFRNWLRVASDFFWSIKRRPPFWQLSGAPLKWGFKDRRIRKDQNGRSDLWMTRSYCTHHCWWLNFRKANGGDPCKLWLITKPTVSNRRFGQTKTRWDGCCSSYPQWWCLTLKNPNPRTLWI